MNAPFTSSEAPQPASPASRFFHPLWLTLAAIALAVTAQFSLLWRLPMPQCLWRRLLGIPCPTCGCTRSLAAWTRLDFAAAFQFNPLFFLLCAALLAWLVAWAVERISGRALLGGLRARFARWPVWRILLGLAAANWIYLCFALRS